MLGYVTIGTTDLQKAAAFYDALLEPIGGKQVMGLDHIKFYGTKDRGAMLAICKPADGKEKSCGNGQMIAIPGGSPEGAVELYNRAIELGATCEGKPGQRTSFFYGCYVRDLDGNKIAFYHMAKT